MNKQVWKFPLSAGDNIIKMPKNAQILSFQLQGETPCMWVLVDPDAYQVKRQFKIYGTGHNIECDMYSRLNFIDTIQMDNGSLVFHLFEKVSSLS